MNQTQHLLEVRSARARNAAAKVVALRGETTTNAGFEGMQMMLDGMRVYLASMLGYPRLVLVPRNSGFALFMQISNGPRVWLIAERSKRVRIFKRVETAFFVCRQLGADRFMVLVEDTPVVNNQDIS